MKGSTAAMLFFALFGLLLVGIGFLINAGNNLTNPLTANQAFSNVVTPLYVVGAISFVVAFVILWFSLDNLKSTKYEVFRKRKEGEQEDK